MNQEKIRKSMLKMVSLTQKDWKKEWDRRDIDDNSESNPERYFQMMGDEIAEAKAELRRDNKVFLTDELGDVLWTYLSLLSHLKELGYIDSMEDVFAGAAKKFQQRSDNVEKVTDFDVPKMIEKWNEVKVIQKRDMALKNERYKKELNKK